LHTNQFEVALPHLTESLEDWWLRARRVVQKSDRRRFDSLVILVAWTLWKQRNARVFGNVRIQLNTVQIIDSVREEFRLWEFARVGGRQLVPRE
jgi:nuclear pore complex protein Nup210